ncbi:hypothetical protein HPP92_007702 [Vanilla planifolia]|uniref:Deoxyhypusine monooxygenase n=1 Tax=Vanilla planifolia TaxID=51239 RepID=A0A835V7Y4_VANPL|nr:hypothetical protein HPP92_007702 [Vanilla planifolia]
MESNKLNALPETVEFLCKRLLDQSQPISERIRALFSLRNLSGDRPREALSRGSRSSGCNCYNGCYCPLESVWMEDSTLEVLETCELALRRIVDQKIAHKGYQASLKDLRFQSVDPALPASFDGSLDQLSEVLLNEEEEIYERYAALFALRNIGHDASVGVIIKALGAKSALLRHEAH